MSDDIMLTPVYVIKQLFDLGYFNPKKYKYVLDPGSGEGSFSSVIKQYNPKVHITSVDINYNTNKYSDVHIYGDFKSEFITLPCHKDEEKLFNLIIGNPPFSQCGKFITEGMNLLSQDGDLIYLLRADQFNPKKMREYREKFWNKEILTLEKRIPFTAVKKTYKKSGVDFRYYSWFHFKHKTKMNDYAIKDHRYSTTITYIPNL